MSLAAEDLYKIKFKGDVDILRGDFTEITLKSILKIEDPAFYKIWRMEEEFKGLFVKAMIYKEVSGMARSEKYDASEFGINFRTPEEVTEQKAYDEKCRIEDEMEASYVPCRGNFFERDGMSHLSDDFEQ